MSSPKPTGKFCNPNLYRIAKEFKLMWTPKEGKRDHYAIGQWLIDTFVLGMNGLPPAPLKGNVLLHNFANELNTIDSSMPYRAHIYSDVKLITERTLMASLLSAVDMTLYDAMPTSIKKVLSRASTTALKLHFFNEVINNNYRATQLEDAIIKYRGDSPHKLRLGAMTQEKLDELVTLTNKLLEGAYLTGEKPYYIVQPWLAILKDHASLINEIK
jgi:hypothetical protein